MNIAMTLAVKLGSLVVHADELTSPDGRPDFDGPAIRALVHDPEIRAFLAAMPPGTLPVKRGQ